MLKMYIYNYTHKVKVSIHKPLEASLEQALEVFDELPQTDGSYFGLINEKEICCQFSKYNKFIWLLEIPFPEKKGNYQIFLTPNKCKSIIHELFNGLDPLKIKGLIFESNNC